MFKRPYHHALNKTSDTQTTPWWWMKTLNTNFRGGPLHGRNVPNCAVRRRDAISGPSNFRQVIGRDKGGGVQFFFAGKSPTPRILRTQSPVISRFPFSVSMWKFYFLYPIKISKILSKKKLNKITENLFSLSFKANVWLSKTIIRSWRQLVTSLETLNVIHTQMVISHIFIQDYEYQYGKQFHLLPL